jgi:hypothetical protein
MARHIAHRGIVALLRIHGSLYQLKQHPYGGEITMAEKAKSATTTPKPRKTAAKKATPSNVTEINAVREPKTSVTREVSEGEIAKLAHQLWLERGRQHGSDAEDWLRAEQLLRGKAS